jgi:hypothetical protein
LVSSDRYASFVSNFIAIGTKGRLGTYSFLESTETRSDDKEMRSSEWERRTILLFLLTLVATLAFDDRPPVTLALPFSASATLLGRVIAFYFPRQRRERMAPRSDAGGQ